MSLELKEKLCNQIIARFYNRKIAQFYEKQCTSNVFWHIYKNNKFDMNNEHYNQ